MPREKKRVAVVGATGMAGQQFIEALDGHPWFEITALYGFSSAGYTYGEKRRGFSAHDTSPEILDMKIGKIADIDLNSVDIVFSAVPGDVAEKVEGEIAAQKPVISTASHYRYQDDVPIYLPVINANHAELIKTQQKKRGWKGFVLPGPNCTTVGLAIATYPIFKKFGIKSIHMVSMQAISGAGYPGVAAYDITSNVIPHIKNEEAKVVKEVKKIFGIVEEDHITQPDFLIDAKCNRVPVINGHMESVFIQTVKPTTVDEIKETLRNYQAPTSGLDLPNAPNPPIYVYDDPYRPQPRIDLQDKSKGMTTFVGGIEESSFSNGFKFTVLSHNTELGAGRGGVLSAEYLVAKDLI